MSKRHVNHRRRSYGRRQHEIHERLDRRGDRARADRAWRPADALEIEPLTYVDAEGPSQPYAFAD